MSRDVLMAVIGNDSELDDSILEYCASILDELSEEEKTRSDLIEEMMGPFLLESGSFDEDKTKEICTKIARSFGGSGFSHTVFSHGPKDDEEEVPALLTAPVKIGESQVMKQLEKRSTYGGVFVPGGGESDTKVEFIEEFKTDGPRTKKELKAQKKLEEMLLREAQKRAHEQEEMRRARMDAIRASRAAGARHKTGVNIERLCLPMPGGNGELLSDVSLVLAPKRKYGLIGKNGAGKSTLMRWLANYKDPGLQHLRILMVDQHVEGDSDSALQWVLRADVERTALLEDEAKLSAVLDPVGGDSSKVDRNSLPAELRGVNIDQALGEVLDRMEMIGVRTAEERAKKILCGLGFDEAMITAPTLELSGGWQMRAALASALFVKPNLLLLDEPTNHLDLHALVWLETYLKEQFEGILLVVSHDRFFLNEICTDVLELRSRLVGQKKALDHYKGDYNTYEKTVAERKIAQSRAREAFESKRDKLKEFISREGRKYDGPSHQAQRKMKEKQLQQLMQEEAEAVMEDSELRITLPEPHGTFDPEAKLLSIQEVGFHWQGKEASPLFLGVDFVVQAGARIALMGRNGCGKTSFLSLLMGESAPTTGSIQRNAGCRITMLQQHHYKGEQLNPELCALEHVRNLPQDRTTAVGILDPGTREEESRMRGYLANFGVAGKTALIQVKHLSGGQRMRVAMAVSLFQKPDLLILDEPTNHLDTDTCRALCKALASFKGAILAVSHDESFVNQVIGGNELGAKADNGHTAASGELLVLSQRRICRYEGSFRQYKAEIRRHVESGSPHQDL